MASITTGDEREWWASKVVTNELPLSAHCIYCSQSMPRYLVRDFVNNKTVLEHKIADSEWDECQDQTPPDTVLIS
jgi:hypothetical protein